jgi:hypothetical protein
MAKFSSIIVNNRCNGVVLMRKALFYMSFIALGACGPLLGSGVPGLAQVDAITVVGTKKTVVDHVVSLSSGKNCSAIRLEKGQHYCEEDEPEIKQNINCYKTLGRVTCYTKPDPHNGRYQKVGQHNSTKIVKPSPVNQK